MVYHHYINQQKLKNIPDTGGYPFIGVAFKLMNQSDYGKKLYIRFHHYSFRQMPFRIYSLM